MAVPSDVEMSLKLLFKSLLNILKFILDVPNSGHTKKFEVVLLGKCNKRLMNLTWTLSNIFVNGRAQRKTSFP